MTDRNAPQRTQLWIALWMGIGLVVLAVAGALNSS